MSAPENAEKQKEDSGQSSYLLWNIISIHGKQYLNFSVRSMSQADFLLPKHRHLVWL